MYDFESQIVDIPDYPEPGVVFKDITPLFGNPEALKAMLERSGFEQVEFFSDCPQGDRGRMFISAKNTSIY